jgi:hypothetical protein
MAWWGYHLFMHLIGKHLRLDKGLCGVVIAALLAGCQTVGTNDTASINFRIPRGSKLVLNREFTIPAGVAHVVFQDGEPGPAANEFEVNCRFEVRDLGPRVIQPDSFLITRWGSQREWVNQPSILRFYKDFHLKSERQADIMPMICQVWSYPLIGRPVTIRQVQEALGEYFTFEFAGQGSSE